MADAREYAEIARGLAAAIASLAAGCGHQTLADAAACLGQSATGIRDWADRIAAVGSIAPGVPDDGPRLRAWVEAARAAWLVVAGADVADGVPLRMVARLDGLARRTGHPRGTQVDENVDA